MQKFIAFMEKYMVPIAGKIGSQRHLAAMRWIYCSYATYFSWFDGSTS